MTASRHRLAGTSWGRKTSIEREELAPHSKLIHTEYSPWLSVRAFEAYSGEGIIR